MQANSKQRSGLRSLSPQSVIIISLTCQHPLDRCIPGGDDFTRFQIGNAFFNHSIVANGKRPFALGTVGDGLQVLCIILMKHLFATI